MSICSLILPIHSLIYYPKLGLYYQKLRFSKNEQIQGLNKHPRQQICVKMN